MTASTPGEPRRARPRRRRAPRRPPRVERPGPERVEGEALEGLDVRVHTLSRQGLLDRDEHLYAVVEDERSRDEHPGDESQQDPRVREPEDPIRPRDAKALGDVGEEGVAHEERGSGDEDGPLVVRLDDRQSLAVEEPAEAEPDRRRSERATAHFVAPRRRSARRSGRDDSRSGGRQAAATTRGTAIPIAVSFTVIASPRSADAAAYRSVLAFEKPVTTK